MKKCRNCLNDVDECDRCEIKLTTHNYSDGICSLNTKHYCGINCFLIEKGATHTEIVPEKEE